MLIISHKRETNVAASITGRLKDIMVPSSDDDVGRDTGWYHVHVRSPDLSPPIGRHQVNPRLTPVTP